MNSYNLYISVCTLFEWDRYQRN